MTSTESPNPSAPEYISRLISTHQVDDVLFLEGDIGRDMFIVLRGEVHITKSSGTSQVLLGSFRAGEFFDEMALVESGVRTGTATVKQANTELVAVNQSRFVYLVSQQPAFALSVMRMMGKRLEESNLRLAELSQELERGVLP